MPRQLKCPNCGHAEFNANTSHFSFLGLSVTSTNELITHVYDSGFDEILDDQVVCSNCSHAFTVGELRENLS